MCSLLRLFTTLNHKVDPLEISVIIIMKIVDDERHELQSIKGNYIHFHNKFKTWYIY